MLLFLSLACDPTTETIDPDAVLYNEHVAPILQERCVGCHQEGAIGPFGLEDYAQVSVLANQVLDSVESRRMPPYLADASGECNTYLDAAWLSDEELQTLADWVEGGALEGDPAAHPGAPLAELDLEGATHSLVLEEVDVDFSASDDNYRCFVVDPGLEEDGFLTAFEVLPGNPAIVHHMIVYAPTSDGALADAYALDDADSEPGYQCFGDARVDSSMLAPWAPGTQSWHFPQGTGVRMSAGRPVVVQMHYNNGSQDSSDATVVNLKVEDSVETELFPFFWVDGSLNIPPGESAHIEESSRGLGIQVPVKLWAVAPHMHKLGVAEQGWIEHDDDTETCLLDVPRWDFNWQLTYVFEEPVVIAPDDRIGMRCTYDSTSVSETTTWGDGTQDEMCLMTMFVSLDN